MRFSFIIAHVFPAKSKYEHRVAECVLAGLTTTYHALSRLPPRTADPPRSVSHMLIVDSQTTKIRLNVREWSIDTPLLL